MNTKETSSYLNFIRGTEPLEFDPGLVPDYRDCFQSDSTRAQVVDKLEVLYEDVPNKGDRLRMISVIGSPNVYFPEGDDEEEFEDELNPFDEPPSK